MSSAPVDQAHEEPSTTAELDKAASDQVVPAKREHSEDVQFISSQPIKKMRLAGGEHGNEGQTVESQAPGRRGEGFAQDAANISMPDRSSSAMPLGLPSHLSVDPAWETRGTSLPAMDNFSFLQTTASSQPAISAAISPKQIPKMAPPSVTGNMQSFGVQASSSRGMTIDQVSCLDVRQPLYSSNVSHDDTRPNNSSTLNTATTVDTMGNTIMMDTVPNANLASFRSLESFCTGIPTPSTNYTQPGDLPLDSQEVFPSVTYSTGNQSHLQQIYLPLNISSFMPTTSNRGLTSSEASPRPTPWMGGPTDTLVPEWSSSSANPPGLHHPRPVRTSEMPLSSAISAWDGISSQPIFQQRRPCPACLAARQQGRQVPSRGHSHGMHSHGNAPMTASVPPSWPGVFGSHNQFSLPVLSAVDGGNVQESSQTSVGASSLSSPAYTHPQTPDARLGPRNNTQAGTPPYPSQGSFTMPHMASVTAHARSGVGSNNGFEGRANTMLPAHGAVLNHAHTLDTKSTRSGVGSNNDFRGPVNTMSPAGATVPNHTLDINGNGAPPCRSTNSIPPSTSVPSGMGSNNGLGGPVNTKSPTHGAVLNHSHSQDINPTTPMPSPAAVPSTPAMPPHTAMSSKTTCEPAKDETKNHAIQAQQQPKASGHQQTQAKPQGQPHLPCAASEEKQQPATISAATQAAASLAASRKKRAANLLVDAAELVAEIFPYEVVARQHGTLPRKVAEALAAVVQVPLLRCATDKRRTGKLGSDRMKEFREARKGWIAMVREWEKEDDDGEDDAEGETDEEAVAGKNGTGVVGRGTVQAPPDPRAVSQPGEPSALNVALLLPPTEMPAQLLRGDFFTGPW